MLDPNVLAIDRFFSVWHFRYAEQFLAALIPMCLTVVRHGYGMDLVRRYFRRFRSPVSPYAHSLRYATLLIGIIAIMLAAHFAEIQIWAVFYYMTDMIGDFRAAMSFSANSYSTIGESGIVLPGRWQGLAGLEALTAILMFGWSTALLAAITQKLHSLDG